MSVYCQGILWFIASLVISNFNDAASKDLLVNFSSLEVVFWRFLSSLCWLVPVVAANSWSCLKTSHIKIHMLRGIMFYSAISAWIMGIDSTSLATVTTISFTVPVFVLVLASIFLKEVVRPALWISTILCFIGTTVVMAPWQYNFRPLSLLLVLASIVFATLDIINKKYIVAEGSLPMLFYSSLFALICSIPYTYYHWRPLDFDSMMRVIILGAGSNGILYCLLRAFRLLPASELSPYRYLELLPSIWIGHSYFQEVPDYRLLIGVMLIVFSTCYISIKKAKM